MADDRVDVVFGARVGELLAGVAEAKEAIEGLRAPIDSFVGNLKGIAEAIGAAFVAEKIKEFAVEMAELGEKTLNSAFIVGSSVKEFARLSGAIQLAGGDADAALRTIQFLGHSIQASLQDPTGKAATGFKNLHISIAELTAPTQTLTGQFDLIIKKVEELSPKLQNAGAIRDVLGRGMQTLAPLLRQGAEGFQELLHAADDYSESLAKNSTSMARTAELINKLTLDTKTLSVQGFRLFQNDINAIVSGLGKLVNWLTSVVEWLNKVSNAVDAAGVRMREFLGEYFGLLGPSARADLPPPGPHRGGADVGTDKSGKGKKGAGGDDRMSVWRDELHQRLQEEGNFFADSKAEELDFWQKKLATVSNGTKEDLKLRRELNTQIFTLQKELAKQTEKNAIEEQTYAEKSNDEIIKRKQAQVAAGVSLNKMSAMDGITAERQLLDEKYRANEDYYNKKLQAALQDKETTKKLGLEENIQYEKYLTERQALDIKAAEASKARWETIIGPIKSALSSAATGVAMGTETLGQAGKNIGQAAIGEAISKGMQAGLDKLGSLLTTILPEAMKSFLGLGEATAQVAAITTGTLAVVTAIEANAVGISGAIWAAMAIGAEFASWRSTARRLRSRMAPTLSKITL